MPHGASPFSLQEAPGRREMRRHLREDMKTRTFVHAVCIFFGILFLPVAVSLGAEPQDRSGSAPAGEVRHLHADATVLTLKTILDSINDLRQDINKKEEDLPLARTEGQKARLLKELADSNARLAGLTRDFQQIATGVNVETYTAKPGQSFDWREELQDVLGPIVKELQGLTARPREIERLRSEISHYEKQIATAKNAIQNVQKLSIETQGQPLTNELERVEKEWKQKEQQVSGQLAVAHYQLNEKIKEQRPFWESFQDLMKVFFKSRGRNFILAITAFVIVLLLFRYVYRVVRRLSPLRSSAERSFTSRLAELLYHVLAVVGATGASLLVLYVSEDWVLLSFAALLLIGMIWTARQTVPKFWTEAKFLLNLGTVRENERVLYGGIPWMVQSLNFNTQLLNPQLKGGMIRLPLHELTSLRSRPYDPDEPWFPCKEDEWVILADGTLGKVALQSPEMVELTLVGGSRKTYPTAGFLRQNPNNISIGFRLSVPLRLDYRHQGESTRDIPDRLKETAWRELNREGFGEDILSIEVEFKEAQLSSLDLAILVDFDGRAALHYDRLTRIIPRIAVEACSEQGWVIPFSQVTIHTGGGIPEGPPENVDPSSSPSKGRRLWGLWR